MTKIFYILVYDSIRPIALWIAAILFGVGLAMMVLPYEILTTFYGGFAGWLDLTMQSWGVIAIMGSVLMLMGLILNKKPFLLFGSFMAFGVFIRSLLAFQEVGAFTVAHVNTVHAIVTLWIMYRLQKDGQIV